MEENKPLESDASEDAANEEAQVESQPSASDPSPQQEAGEEDVSTSEDVLAKIEEASGRKFKDMDDYIKHYKNLTSLVGKAGKTEKSEPEAPRDVQSDKVIERLDRFEFLNENPDAKEHFEEFIKPISRAQGVSLTEAWTKFKPYVEASKAKENAKEIGVNSKNRIAPLDDPKMKDLTKNARSGSPSAQEALVESLINSGQLG